MTQTQTHRWHQAAWTELTGYVLEACMDGTPINPDALRCYMVELKHRYQLPPTQDNLMDLLASGRTNAARPTTSR